MTPPANAVREDYDVELYSDTDPWDEVAEHFDRSIHVSFRIEYREQNRWKYTFFYL